MIMKELVKFLIVGGISTILNYGIFFSTFKIMNINFLIASGMGYITGLVLGYFLNKNWTFNYKTETKKTKLRYLIVYLINLILSLIILKILNYNLNLNPLVGNLIAIGYTTIANYICIKIFVFIGE